MFCKDTFDSLSTEQRLSFIKKPVAKWKEKRKEVSGALGAPGEAPLSGESSEAEDPKFYQDVDYWKLPENVRHAMDIAYRRTKHSAFYYKLATLNDKITIYKTAFYLRKTAQEALFDKR